MTFKCSVPGCRSNYKSDTARFSVFSFPKNTILHQRWVNAMPTEDFQSYKSSKVCELHFEPSQILREAFAWDRKTGRKITARLAIPRLRKGAVPTRFACPPELLLKSRKGKKKKTPNKETEKTYGQKLAELLMADTGTESQKASEPSIVTRKELIESTDKPPLLISPNVIYLDKLVPSSSSSSLSNSLPSSSSASSSSNPTPSISLPTSSSLDSVMLQTGPGTESQNAAEPSFVIKGEVVESADEPPPRYIDNIFFMEELVPSSVSLSDFSSFPHSKSLPPSNKLLPSSNSSINLPSSSSFPSSTNLPPSNTPPICISSTFSENSLPVSIADSTNVGEITITNKPERKRKISNLKPNTNNSAQCSTHSKLHRFAKSPVSSKKSKMSPTPNETKESDGLSMSPSENAQDAAREVFQSLLNDTENSALFCSRSSERPGDLFDVFASFLADKLREMNWESCAFALRAILDIVFKAGRARKSSEKKDVSNPGGCL